MLLTAKNRATILEDARIQAALLDSDLNAENKTSLNLILEELLSKAETFARNEVETLQKELAAFKTEFREEILKAAAEQAVAAKEAEVKAKYDSDEPYVSIVSGDFTREGGVQLRLDWNAAFITYLRANGFTGATDEAIVDRWITSLSNERMSEATAGKSDFK